MIFKPEMAEKVMRARKTQTRRPADAKTVYEVGRDYAVQPGRGKFAIGRIVIVSYAVEPLGFITEHDARREGFDDRRAFLAYWQSLYGALDLSQVVRAYHFRVVERDGVPT